MFPNGFGKKQNQLKNLRDILTFNKVGESPKNPWEEVPKVNFLPFKTSIAIFPEAEKVNLLPASKAEKSKVDTYL